MQNTDPLLTGAATIRGDLRDLILANLAGQKKLWRDMPEAEQKALAQQIDGMCAALVTQIAVLTATGGRPAVLATLENMNIGAECKAILTVPKEHAGALIASTKQIVAVMQPSAASFMGQRAPAATQPDQLDLVAQADIGKPTSVQSSPELLAMIEQLCGSSAERCLPERPETLQLQQTALIEGLRPCQMFPTGTAEFPLPGGMERIVTDRGVFHFNPDEIDVVSIVSASNAGEENLVLGLGPYSKAEIMKLAAEGEPVICVVEVAGGTTAATMTEVLTAVTVDRFADEIIEVMSSHAADGHRVVVMTVEDVLKHRLGGTPGTKVIEVVAGQGAGGSTTAATSEQKKPMTAAQRRKARNAKARERRASKKAGPPQMPRQAAAPAKPNGQVAPKSAAPPSKPTGSPFAR